MCFYTYHHYSACGHIANWTLNSCKEYTNSLRLQSRGGRTGYCNKIQTTHNLVLQLASDTCGQCDFELSTRRVHSVSSKHRTIEGLDLKAPIFEVFGHMNTNLSGKNRNNNRPSIYQDCPGCDCYHCTASAASDGLGPDDTIYPTNIVADVPQCPDGFLSWPECPTNTGQDFDILPQVLPSEEQNIADLCKALRRQTLEKEISPSSTQVDARKSRNSLHGVIPFGIDKDAHLLERLDSRNSYATGFFDLSEDMSPVEFGLTYSGNEPEQEMFHYSDDSSDFETESEVRNPNDLNFLDDDSDTDDESDGGCDLLDESDDDFVKVFSPFISTLVSNSVDVSLPYLRDSALVVDRPTTPMLCPEPLRVIQPPQFLSLDSIVEDNFLEKVCKEEDLDIIHREADVTPEWPLGDDQWDNYWFTEPRSW